MGELLVFNSQLLVLIQKMLILTHILLIRQILQLPLRLRNLQHPIILLFPEGIYYFCLVRSSLLIRLEKTVVGQVGEAEILLRSVDFEGSV